MDVVSLAGVTRGIVDEVVAAVLAGGGVRIAVQAACYSYGTVIFAGARFSSVGGASLALFAVCASPGVAAGLAGRGVVAQRASVDLCDAVWPAFAV